MEEQQLNVKSVVKEFQLEANLSRKIIKLRYVYVRS